MRVKFQIVPSRALKAEQSITQMINTTTSNLLEINHLSSGYDNDDSQTTCLCQQSNQASVQWYNTCTWAQHVLGPNMYPTYISLSGYGVYGVYESETQPQPIQEGQSPLRNVHIRSKAQDVEIASSHDKCCG